MPAKNIIGSMIVDKDGNKQTILNLSNARRMDYSDFQNLTPEQKKGVIIARNTPAGGIGTAAHKDFTTSVTQDSTDLVTSGAVYSYINSNITQALNNSY